MNNENQTIHDFDFSLICNYFKLLERQGPGSPEMTLKALEFIDNLSPSSQIVDLGCGTGGQTLTLARATESFITGLDLFPDFIDILNVNAAKAGFQDRVKGIVRSMDDLPFEEGSLDLIWSEGAIYNIGFERGMNLWHHYLKPGGYVAVTEAAWFSPQRPSEIEDFWNAAYPEIATIPVQVSQMMGAGYKSIAHFILPEMCWTDHFYKPQHPVREDFLARYPEKPEVLEFIKSQRHEETLYYKYKSFYGYVFHIGQKI